MTTTRRTFLKTTAAMGAISLPLPAAAFARRSAQTTEPVVTGLLGIPIVQDKRSAGAFPLVSQGHSASLSLDAADYAGVHRAANDLAEDIFRVTGMKPGLRLAPPHDPYVIIIGTVGHNATIDGLVAAGRLDASDLKGKWESFVITAMANPLPGVKEGLVIAGSDKRGTIYGIYELSEQLGVSPWYWWADVPAKTRASAFVVPGRFASGEPVVRYRGIFINDEAPCLTRWTTEKFGGFNSRMYTHMFELILRLRGNYLWPAMWDSTFNEDDPENPRLADEYGIVMGTSHHEPLMRAQKEWTKSHTRYGNGEWDYRTNGEGLRTFWREGMRRNGHYDNLVTMGMRGDGDLAMPSAGGLQADIKTLEGIIADQRRILADEVNPDITKVPQLWALFTEVQKFYDNGMKVPDDVTLLFTDDNVGNLRRLPTPEERARSGGAGIYYHFDMHGGPYAYQWINTNPFPKIWEQMSLASEYGANRIWIVNVGDLKPLELPIEFFIRLGWNPKAIKRDQIDAYTRRWAARDFEAKYASEIADIVSLYTKYNGWRKPEMVKPETYSLLNYREAERVEQAWTAVASKAEVLWSRLPESQRDAYYQLVLYPTKASAGVALMNIWAARSQLFGRQGRASTNATAQRARDLFKQDRDMTNSYNHQLAGGKWNHLMDQPHLGEFTWQPPRVDMLPPVSEVVVDDTDEWGVGIEGDDSAWPNHYGDPVLPTFDSFNPRRSYIDVFAQGRRAPNFTIRATADWIRITEDPTPPADRRFWVDIDWGRAPEGAFSGLIEVTDSSTTPDPTWPKRYVAIKVTGIKASSDMVQAAKGAYASLTGTFGIAAARPTRKTAVAGASWEPIKDYGRGIAAMGIVPVTAPSVIPPSPAPQLHYDLYLPKGGDYDVYLILGPVMDCLSQQGMRIAVAFDDARPQVIDLFKDRMSQTFLSAGWEKAARDNVRVAMSTHKIQGAGRVTLRIIMVDPTIVVQKIIISDRPLRDSYFGPEEIGVS